MPAITQTQAQAPGPTRSWGALLAKGFRPFFLCAAAYAVIAVPLFLWTLDGSLDSSAYLPSIYWHAHEMMFGFTAAVLAGFLLTAVENWTQRRTVAGPLLAALVGLWAAGRVVMFVPDVLPRHVPAAVDLAFLPALWVACARPLLATRNRRNYALLAILAGLWLANAAVHAAALGFVCSGSSTLGAHGLRWASRYAEPPASRRCRSARVCTRSPLAPWARSRLA